MARPDPRNISRRPMAMGQPMAAYRPAQATTPLAVLVDGVLDPDRLYQAFDAAEVALEGGTYRNDSAGTLFLGSATLRAFVVDAPAVAALFSATTLDSRAREVVQARVAREVARLLGARAPSQLRLVTLRASATQVLLRLDCDLEGASAPIVTLAR